ncbi:MAG: hypothetical protein ACE5D8_01560 [Fidelibacterota bacterium]
MIRILIFVFGLSGLYFAQTFIDTVKAEFHSHHGLRIDFSLTQDIQGNRHRSNGRFEIFSPDSFAYENGNSIIKVTGQTIATFSPTQQHVILETYSPEMYNSLSIFTGNFSGVQLQIKARHGKKIECNLFVPDYDISGTIWFNAESYLPDKLVVGTESADTVRILVDNIKEIKRSELMNRYTIDAEWEILDLRE